MTQDKEGPGGPAASCCERPAQPRQPDPMPPATASERLLTELRTNPQKPTIVSPSEWVISEATAGAVLVRQYGWVATEAGNLRRHRR